MYILGLCLKVKGLCSSQPLSDVNPNLGRSEVETPSLPFGNAGVQLFKSLCFFFFNNNIGSEKLGTSLSRGYQFFGVLIWGYIGMGTAMDVVWFMS